MEDEQSDLTFLGMPDDSLLEVLKRTDTISILQLRKVCHHLRNLIDDRKPDLKIPHLEIRFALDNFVMIHLHLTPEERIRIIYGQKEDVDEEPTDLCFVMRDQEQIEEFPNQNYLDLFFADLKIWMSQQSSTFVKFEVVWAKKDKIGSYQEKFNGLATVLADIPLIKTEEIVIKANNHKEILKVLPRVNSEILKKVNIGIFENYTPEAYEIYSSPDNSDSESSEDEKDYIAEKRKFLDTSEIIQLEQWKSVKEIDMDFCVAIKDIPLFERFEKASIAVKGPLIKFLDLKDIYIKSPKIETIRFYPYDLEEYPEDQKYYRFGRNKDRTLMHIYPNPHKFEELIAYECKVRNRGMIQLTRIPRNSLSASTIAKYLNE